MQESSFQGSNLSTKHYPIPTVADTRAVQMEAYRAEFPSLSHSRAEIVERRLVVVGIMRREIKPCHCTHTTLSTVLIIASFLYQVLLSLGSTLLAKEFVPIQTTLMRGMVLKLGVQGIQNHNRNRKRENSRNKIQNEFQPVMPAFRSSIKVSTSLEAGPIVPIIFVIAGRGCGFCGQALSC